MPSEVGKDLEGFGRNPLDVEPNTLKFTLKTEATHSQPVGNLTGIRNG